MEDKKESYAYLYAQTMYNMATIIFNQDKVLREVKEKLDIVMTKDFTRLGEWEPYLLIDQCRDKINTVLK